MTSGDMKVELNEDRERENTIPSTYTNFNYSKTNPETYDRNIGEIDFNDPDLECSTGEVSFPNDYESDESLYDDPPRRLLK